MQSLRYDDLKLGVKLEGSTTVTESHLVTSSGLFNDFNPMHSNEEVAKKSAIGRRILHAPTTIGIMLGALGNAVAGTGIGDLETNFKFKHHIGIGDTISFTWEVVERIDKPKFEGGVIILEGRCVNQDGVQTIEARNVILVSNNVITG